MSNLSKDKLDALFTLARTVDRLPPLTHFPLLQTPRRRVTIRFDAVETDPKEIERLHHLFFHTYYS